MKIKINISWIILFLMLLNVLLSVGIIEKKIDKLNEQMLIGLNVVGYTLDEIEKELK